MAILKKSASLSFDGLIALMLLSIIIFSYLYFETNSKQIELKIAIKSDELNEKIEQFYKASDH